jgi:peptidoglycan/LPS O-acetylase OafA/YrhL
LKILPNLNPLRFFLASLVILFHLPELCRNQGLPYFNDLPIFNRGMQAVYMFFVLSGFLIIRLIYINKLNNSFSIKRFYARRVLRIFPLYYLIVIFGLIFYNVILSVLNIPFEINYDFKEAILLTTFFLPNIFAFQYAPGGILEVLWSIGIEEQFYLIIAPLMFLIKKNNILKSLVVFVSVYFIVFHINVFEVLRDYSFIYFFLFSGGIAAILEEQKKLEFFKKSIIYPIIIVITTLVYFTTDILEFNQLWLNNFFISIIFSLFIHTLSFNNHKVIITNRKINYLGKISYGIYMFHVLALNAVVFLFLKFDEMKIFNDILSIILINIFTFVLTILMAHLSFKYFESYFLKLKNKYR